MPEQTINGVEIHYEDQGSGPALVFQHAWLSSSVIWGGVVPQLTDRYRCITLDTRGAGDSERTEDGHNSEQYAADLLALTSELGVDDFTLAGHSSGGFVAVEAARQAPDRVKQLVLVGSFVDAGYLPDGFGEQLLGLAELVASRGDGARDALVGFFGSACVRCPEEALEGAADLALSASPGFIRGAIQSVAATQPGDAIAEITTPTLVIGGSADPFLDACITAHRGLPNSALQVFNRVGHMIPAEVPVELAALIDDFAQHGVVATPAG